MWEEPIERAKVTALGVDWSPDGNSLVTVQGPTVVVVPALAGDPRPVYTPRPGTTDPTALWPRWLNASTIVFKSLTGDYTSFWAVAATGGTPRMLVRFDDPKVQSYRSDWATDGKRLYFPIQDRQSDLWVVEFRDR
jgi:hypothetical protein